jgi:DNA modification methylase
MFSFVGDTVLDPFMGTGTTNLAASMWGRSSIGVELDDQYFDMAAARMNQKQGRLFRTNTKLSIERFLPRAVPLATVQFVDSSDVLT